MTEVKQKNNRKRNKEKRSSGSDSLQQFNKDVESMVAKKVEQGQEAGVKLGKFQLTRKQRRKNERKLKKAQKNAFFQHKPLPTMASIQKVKADPKDIKEKKRKKKLRQRRERKQQRHSETKEETEKEQSDDNDTIEDVRKKTLLEANKEEDKLLKHLEKQLFMNRKKKKNTQPKLPKAFMDDGLDYILEAVDSSNMKGVFYGTDDEGSDSDLSDLDTTGQSMESDEDSDGEMSDAEDSSDEETEEQEERQTKKTRKPAQVIDVISEKYGNLPKGILRDAPPQKDKSKNVSFRKEDEVVLDDETEQKNIDAESDDDDIINSLDDDDGDDDIDRTKSLSRKRKKKSKNVEKVKVSRMTKNDRDSDGDDDSGSDDENIKFDSDNDDDEDSDNDDDEDIDNKDDEDKTDSVEKVLSNKKSEVHASEYKEDIYGRLRDTQGNIVEAKASSSRYVPPGKRLAMASTTDEKRQLELERIGKQLKGFINRLSEATMQSIGNQIEELYRSHSRANMTEALTGAVMAACIQASRVPDRLIMEQAMLLSMLHNNIGSEVGGMVLQTLAARYTELCEGTPQYGEAQHMENLLVLIGHMYNFKIIQSLLIFDLLKKHTDSFTQRDIEIILLIFRTVGATLRKDDPTGLKDLILQIQAKASSADTTQFEDKSRVSFMLEVLMAIRNNNMRKIPNYDPEHVEHLKKLLRNFSQGSLDSQQLRISLADLQNADLHGRWWLVGSAWSGRVADEPENDEKESKKSSVGKVSSHILELARKQRMNTDIRKNIFCVLMTSEDPVDAFEKLLNLKLKTQQQTEIVNVIIDVCLQEVPFNPYYAFLVQKFCELDRKYQMGVQFSTWDRFRELGNFKKSQLHNLANLLKHLLATSAISLSIFKVLEFSELDKPRVQMMKRILMGLLREEDYNVQRVFSRIAPLPKLSMLRDGLKLFMRHFLLRPLKNKADQDPASIEDLENRIQIAEKALNSMQAMMM